MEKKEMSLDEFFREIEERERSLAINEIDSVEVEIETYEDDEFDFVGIPTEKSIEVNESSQLESQRALLEKEREELDRRQKDFENYRRRIERERSEMMGNLMADLATRLLPIVDNLERAIEASKKNPVLMKDECHSFIEGITMVSQQLYEVLAEMGVEPIPTVGLPFDPNLHEAVEVEKNNDLPNKTITHELLRGYKIGNKIVRHALVKVAVNDDNDKIQANNSEIERF